MAVTVVRSDQALIHVNLPGFNLGTEPWDMFEGGDSTAETVNYLPGGMAPARELGGIPKRGDITVERAWSDTLIAAYKALDQSTGLISGSCSYTPMNADKTTAGQPTFTYTVVLKSCTRPNYDSGTAAIAKLRLVFGADVTMA